MRLDKFLKVSRLIKRRTVAKDVSEQGRIWINGREAKASSSVKVGDELQIQYGQKIVTVKVERIAETSRKDEAAEMYTLLKEEARGNRQIESRLPNAACSFLLGPWSKLCL
jgi:ribosomal 50S subunit-recycling heat shock protein